MPLNTASASDPKPIGWLFQGNNMYQVPLYQRTFCWSENKGQLKKYKEDLARIFETYTSQALTRESIFLGAIILQPHEHNISTGQRYTVIDGQQRLTTIYLTLAALATYSEDRGWSDLSRHIVQSMMTSSAPDFNKKPLIEPTNLDTKQFALILQKIHTYPIIVPSGDGESTGNMLKAYNFIRFNIIEPLIKDIDSKETEGTFKAFRDCFLEHFVIADITLGIQHNPNEVFDRLNTRGERLSIVDLVRNNLFLEAKRRGNEAETFYNAHWKPFEDSLKTVHAIARDADGDTIEDEVDKQVDNFFFPYGINVLGRSCNKTNLVSKLHENWRRTEPAATVSDMNKYITPYFAVMNGYEDYPDRIPSYCEDDLRQSLIHLHQMKILQPTYGFLMRCLLEVKEGSLEQSDAATSLQIMESFFVRRFFVFQEEGTGYHAIFKRLWDDTQGKPHLVRKKMPTETKLFPNDAEFKNGILARKLYKTSIEKYCLMQYEEELADQAWESYPGQEIDSTDHISPQNPREEATEEERVKYESTLNLWGNLLPMSSKLNARISNRNIQEVYGLIREHSRFESSTKWYEDYRDSDEWTPALIENRTAKIADWALVRWPSFETSA